MWLRDRTAQDFAYVGTNNGHGFTEEKDYTSNDGQFLYDVLYVYGSGGSIDYSNAETRISSASKLYAAQEFSQQRGNEYLQDWDVSEINTYVNGVTQFDFTPGTVVAHSQV